MEKNFVVVVVVVVEGWYIHKPESVFENETHKILLVFEVQIWSLIQVTNIRPCVNRQEGIICTLEDFAVLEDNSVKMMRLEIELAIMPRGYRIFNGLFSKDGLLWFGSVLWHINHCRLFNAKSSL